MKIYCVAQKYYDSGEIRAYVEIFERDEKPMNSCDMLERYDLYLDYFTDENEAAEFRKQALRA